jgi:hypothetical protein
VAGKQTHDARPLTKEEAEALYGHIRRIETLTAEKDDIQADITEAKTLCCEQLPVQKDVLDFVIKRRKANRGTVGNFDQMLEFLEEAVAEVENERRTGRQDTGNLSPSAGQQLQ